MFLFKKTIGWKENVSLCINGYKFIVTATCDTGNGGMAPTLSVDSLEYNEETNTITFVYSGREFKNLRVVGITTPHVGTETHKRYAIDCDYIQIAGRRLKNIQLALSDKRKKSTRALINRNTLRDLKLVVDPDLEFTA